MILYEVLNERADVLAERTYAVWPDLEALMREHGVGAVHRRRPPAGRARSTCSACRFSTELGYTNLLDRARPRRHPAARAGPRRARTRSSSPAGTPRSTPSRSPTSSTRPCSATASRPSARSPTSCATGRPRAAGRPRRRCCDGSPRPAACTSRASTTSSYLPTAGSSRSRRTAPACPSGSPSTPSWTSTSGRTRRQPLVPLAETVHERMSVEIFRGCTRGCRFCQAGMITRPVRER